MSGVFHVQVEAGSLGVVALPPPQGSGKVPFGPVSIGLACYGLVDGEPAGGFMRYAIGNPSRRGNPWRIAEIALPAGRAGLQTFPQAPVPFQLADIGDEVVSIVHRSGGPLDVSVFYGDFPLEDTVSRPRAAHALVPAQGTVVLDVADAQWVSLATDSPPPARPGQTGLHPDQTGPAHVRFALGRAGSWRTVDDLLVPVGRKSVWQTGKDDEVLAVRHLSGAVVGVLLETAGA